MTQPFTWRLLAHQIQSYSDIVRVISLRITLLYYVFDLWIKTTWYLVNVPLR